MKKTITTFIAALCTVLLLWAFVSWLEISAKSLTEHPQYDDKNFFIVTIGD